MGLLKAGGRHTAPIALLVFVALGAAACQGTRIPYLNAGAATPEPLTPASAGAVEAGELKPADGAVDAGDFPEAPRDGTVNVEVAAVEVAVAVADVADAPDIAKNSIVGSWKTASAGVGCQMFLTLTKYGDNSRGGTRGCAGELQAVRAWNVAGKQLVLFDETGAGIAVLYSTGTERFDGRTAGGQTVSLSR